MLSHHFHYKRCWEKSKQLLLPAALVGLSFVLLACSNNQGPRPDLRGAGESSLTLYDQQKLERFKANAFNCSLAEDYLFLLDIEQNAIRKQLLLEETNNNLTKFPLLASLKEALEKGCGEQLASKALDLQNLSPEMIEQNVLLRNPEGKVYFSANLMRPALVASYDRTAGLDSVSLELTIQSNLPNFLNTPDSYVILTDIKLADAYHNQGSIVKAVANWLPNDDLSVAKWRTIARRITLNQEYRLALVFSIRNYNFTPSPYYILSFVFQDRRVSLRTPKE